MWSLFIYHWHTYPIRKVKKALYRLLRSSLLFYRNMCGELESYGFKINPYDPCVGNKMVTTETVVPVIDKKGRIIQDKHGSKKMCKVKGEKNHGNLACG